MQGRSTAFRRRQAVDLLQLLDSALYERCFRSLVTEAADKCFDAFDLLSLGAVRFCLSGPPFLPLDQIAAVRV